jgi:hypothetical protein
LEGGDIMEIVFQWVGFIALSLMILAIAFYTVVLAMHFTVDKLNTLKLVAKIMSGFYLTLPKVDSHKPYVLCLFDRKTGKIITSVNLNKELLTVEEILSKREDLKRKISK